MIKRTLYFGNPAYLRKKDNQLVVQKTAEMDQRSVPIEDIAFMIVDHPQVNLSHGLCNALIENQCCRALV